MIIFAGHHVKSQGALNCKSSEFVEAALIVELVSLDPIASRGDFITTKEKISVMNTICDSLYIDVHYNTDTEPTCIDGPVVMYKPDCERSKIAAEILQTELNSVLNFKNEPRVGYYHNDEKYGVDYFLTSDHPALIVCPDHWGNYEAIKNKRAIVANAIITGLKSINSGR